MVKIAGFGALRNLSAPRTRLSYVAPCYTQSLGSLKHTCGTRGKSSYIYKSTHTSPLKFTLLYTIADKCKIDNGDCAHTCSHTDDGIICECREGFVLGPDGKSCEDIDECNEGTDDCEQDCDNTEGGFECSCDEGYILDTDGKTCTGKCVSDKLILMQRLCQYKLCPYLC